MIDKVISYPFAFSRSFDKQYIASIDSTNDQKRVWKSRILLVLGTKPGERVMRPNFGSTLYKAVFEPQNAVSEVIRESISVAFTEWLPDLNLKEIRPSYEKTSGVLTITIIYGLPNGEIDDVTINTGKFSRSGELLQEITNG